MGSNILLNVGKFVFFNSKLVTYKRMLLFCGWDQYIFTNIIIVLFFHYIIFNMKNYYNFEEEKDIFKELKKPSKVKISI